MRRACLAWAVAVAVAAGAGWPRPVLAAEPQSVSFAARDGVLVSGTLFLPDKVPAPGVVLLHMATRSHHDWDATCAALAKAGVAALAIDFRRSGTASPDAGSWTDLVLDAEAARAYLAARPEIVPSRIGMAGASLGANVAVLAAVNDPAVRSLALLSASLDYRGLRIEQAVQKYGGRPALIVASAEDPYALRSARTLVTTGEGQRELRVLSEAGHGSVMLVRQPDLVDALVDWFLRTLL